MFNGIIEEIGTIIKIEPKKNLSVLSVQARKVLKGAKQGSSIAINGACLTITDIKGNVLFFDMIRETILKTTLGSMKKGGYVNLEPALKANSRIDGHFVTGHVDDVVTVKERIDRKDYTELRIALNKKIARYIVPKGSVCLDGVSLTVGQVTKQYFAVHLIPFTKKATTLGCRSKGDRVNIETDIIAKYIVNRKTSGTSLKKLKEEIASWN